jgi:hypothetical protein
VGIFTGDLIERETHHGDTVVFSRTINILEGGGGRYR